MAVEPRRACGFRKIGGLYLVSGPGGVVCDRLPIVLDVCRTCGAGIKQTMGWTWVQAAELVGGIHLSCADDFPCPLCMAPQELGRCGLLWIGEQFYRSPEEFEREGAALGISRRISAIPRGFKPGVTWLLLAHPRGFQAPLHCPKCGHGVAIVARPKKRCVDLKCCRPLCEWSGPAFSPAIFHVWRPQRIEKIFPESWKIDPNHFEELQDCADRGITPVFVPDDDPDHRGTVYGDAQRAKLGEESEA